MAYRQGVKFLKINKTDSLGEDKTSILSQLTNIRVQYSDIGIVQYNVFGVTQYPSYFLYQVNYKDAVSPVDRGVNNYRLVATSSNLDGLATSVLDTVIQVQNYNTVAVPNDRFTDNEGTYTIKESEHFPNVLIIYTASVDYNTATATYPITPTLRFSTGDASPGTVITSSSPGQTSSPGTIRFSGTFVNPYPSNTNYFLEVFATSSNGSTPVNFTNARWFITQSVGPTGNNPLLVVPSPNTALKFDGTDCDVTYGLVDTYDRSQYYMDVDYSTGATIPTNQIALVSGTATPAPVKDYYYYLLAQTLPRYQGSREQQYKLNEYTGPSQNLLIDGAVYTGDTGYDKNPGIQLNQTYFAWFSDVQGATPEYNDAVNVSIKYLIDSLGNTYSPGLTKYFRGDVISNFAQNQIAELNFIDANQGTNSTPTAIKTALNGFRKVIRPGVKASAVLYSQTGSSINAYTQSLQFTTILGGSGYKTLTDYRFGAQQYGTQTIPFGTSNQQLTFTTENWDFNAGYNTGTSQYTFQSTPQSKIRFVIKLGQVYSFSADSQIILRKNSSTDIFTEPLTLRGTLQPASTTFTTPYFNFQQGDTLQVLIKQGSTYPIEISQGGTSREWLAEQQLLAQQDVPSITAPFFYTSSANPYILTASLQFSSSINQVYQVGISGSGFDLVRYKASFEPGDQLRFENNELNAYTIIKIISSSTETRNGETYMLLDQPMTNATNLSHFVLRRFAPDPSNIIIEGIKPAGGTGAGTFTPPYLSKQLQDNMASIVSKLSRENII